MFAIMVVEDDRNTRKLMETVLERNGYSTVLAGDGAEALELLDRHHVDLIVLDVMMPNMDGNELAKTLREYGYDIPIIMVTAKESLEDKKKGFLSGTDDYMVKPVDEEEMLLRIAALLRRYKATSEHRLVIGSTKLDYNSMTVNVDGESQELPQKEFLILFKLLSYRDKIFTRRQLMDEIWGPETDTDGRTVDVHINRIRDRFKGSHDFEIVTVRGLGYKAVAKNE